MMLILIVLVLDTIATTNTSTSTYVIITISIFSMCDELHRRMYVCIQYVVLISTTSS